MEAADATRRRLRRERMTLRRGIIDVVRQKAATGRNGAGP